MSSPSKQPNANQDGVSNQNGNITKINIKERNNLRSQNDQLWKIIEKQKQIINNLQNDNKKLLYEKDRLLVKLKEAGGASGGDALSRIWLQDEEFGGAGGVSVKRGGSLNIVRTDHHHHHNNGSSIISNNKLITSDNNIISNLSQKSAAPNLANIEENPQTEIISQPQQTTNGIIKNSGISNSNSPSSSLPPPSSEIAYDASNGISGGDGEEGIDSRSNTPISIDSDQSSSSSPNLITQLMNGTQQLSSSSQTSPKQNPSSPTSVKSSGSSGSGEGTRHKRNDTNGTEFEDSLVFQFTTASPTFPGSGNNSQSKENQIANHRLSQLPPRKNSVHSDESSSPTSPRNNKVNFGLPKSPRSGPPPGVLSFNNQIVNEENDDMMHFSTDSHNSRRESDEKESGHLNNIVRDNPAFSKTFKDSTHRNGHLHTHSLPVNELVAIREDTTNEMSSTITTDTVTRDSNHKHSSTGSLTHINSVPNLNTLLSTPEGANTNNNSVSGDNYLKFPKHAKSFESMSQNQNKRISTVSMPNDLQISHHHLQSGDINGNDPVFTYPSNSEESLGVPAMKKNRNSAVFMKSNSLPVEEGQSPLLLAIETPSALIPNSEGRKHHLKNQLSMNDLHSLTSSNTFTNDSLSPPARRPIMQSNQSAPRPSLQRSDTPTLISSDAISGISVRVEGSNIKTNEKGKEVLAFVISVGRAKVHDGIIIGMEEELWRVEKLYSDFLALDAKLKQRQNRSLKIGKLPDKNLFSNNAPSKVDQRKLALENYLKHIISLPLKDSKDLCEFLSTDVVEQDEQEYSNAMGHKEGYLTKRGKKIGGWKTRYFVLKSPMLEYYESKDGHQLGTIRLTNAQIGRQQSTTPIDADQTGNENSYRHAFLILESKQSSKGNRHVLCAESDAERDQWVNALLQYVNVSEADHQETRKRGKEKATKLAKQNIEKINAQPISQLGRDENNYKLIVSEAVLQQAREEIRQESNISPTKKKGSSDSISRKNHNADGESNHDSISGAQVSSSNSNSAYVPTHHVTSSVASTQSFSSQLSVSLPTNHNSLFQQQQQQDASYLQSRLAVSTNNQSNKRVSMMEADNNSSNNLTRLGAGTPEPKEVSPVQQQPSSSLAAGGGATTLLPVFPSNGVTRRAEEDRKDKDRKGVRMTFFGKSMFGGGKDEKKHRPDIVPDQSRVVFGVPLEQAISVARIKDGYELPAVVYRCIEYLDAKNAAFEEGIYRLSGSSATIKILRERFNTEGDVNLLAEGEYYDVHAVAGVLKAYLRELPTSVLTRELHMEFVNVIDLLERRDRVNELGRLVSSLPLANYTLLRTLTGHLIRVVQNSDINKMTVRNIGIVYSPTLGIPAGVFSLFMAEFEYIFFIDGDGLAAPRSIEEPETVSHTNNNRRPSASSLRTTPIHTKVSTNSIANPEDPASDEDPIIALSPKSAMRRRDIRDELSGRSNRNSVHYLDNAPDSVVGLERKMTVKTLNRSDDDDDEVNDLELQMEDDDLESESSGEDPNMNQNSPRQSPIPGYSTSSAPQSPHPQSANLALLHSNSALNTHDNSSYQIQNTSSTQKSNYSDSTQYANTQQKLFANNNHQSYDDNLSDRELRKQRRLTVRNFTQRDSMYEVFNEQHRELEEMMMMNERNISPSASSSMPVSKNGGGGIPNEMI
ncbi:6547_t:CDS:2 [Ambispora gerdemannii]|uniref:6547_t:CDS:1 n=1 Tax=Ambispora gerdemannii TaxID=144530 RepID=A0A9N9C817_9GLOM|nr:6547_t:CDS:2 [Ambispora gerdemannii]